MGCFCCCYCFVWSFLCFGFCCCCCSFSFLVLWGFVCLVWLLSVAALAASFQFSGLFFKVSQLVCFHLQRHSFSLQTMLAWELIGICLSLLLLGSQGPPPRLPSSLSTCLLLSVLHTHRKTLVLATYMAPLLTVR